MVGLGNAFVRIGVALLVGAPAVAVAQADYPNRTIRIIVLLTPGGTADILPRIIGEKLSLRFGKPVVIENKPGGGQHIGTEAVARAEPDGYTLLSSASGPLDLRNAKSSAADLKFVRHPLQTRLGTSNRKAALES